MSKQPSTIVRSDAPHMVEVKPGSLNAKSSTAWVDAGELDPDDLIDVVEAKDDPNRQKLGADGPIQDNRQAVPGGAPIQDNRQAIDQAAVTTNRQPVGEGEAIRDRFAPLPDDADATHREALPPTTPAGQNRQALADDALADQSAAEGAKGTAPNRAAVPTDRIQDVRVPLPDTEVHRATVDLSGAEVHDAPNPQAPAAAGVVPSGHHQPAEAPIDPVAKAFAHLTHSEQQAAFKSRVAAIRQSVSQINHQLDDLNKE
jgi:hypothetical protein